ncbi:unnamed protein product [Adineta ricciae]|uniref:Uncharacterized protein n=1 Tax=Adineta ricciae TaxID=249248 RepID=A0A815W838_ADIRI|nr:unnamed protein product [Adineta ricciae]
MYISVVLCLLIFSAAHANTTIRNQIYYPPLWHTVPSTLNEYPLINNSYRLIDPWYYPHRLGLYKILIDVTTPLMPFCTSSNASNILFAFPSQFGWQFESNRLFTNGTLNISLNSWWASANYYLSVIPFLAAVDVGLIPNTTFQIVQQENFCSNAIDCLKQVPKAMNRWREFFSLLQECSGDFNNRILDTRYLGPMWHAYQGSIENAVPLIESKLAFLPSNAERSFGQGWARLLGLIAMARKNTNLYETLKNQRAFLPFRMLSDNDRLTGSNDLPDLVRKSLEVLFTFRFDWLSQIERVWEKLTCNYEARVYAQYALESMAISKVLAAKYLAQAIINALMFQCDRSFRSDL